MNDFAQINYAITLLADVIIEHEGAFGMTFGDPGISFEARWKCGNEVAYAKKQEKDWTLEETLAVLDGIREYLKGEFGVEDDEPNGPIG